MGRNSLDFESVEFQGEAVGVQEAGLGQRYIFGNHWYRNGTLKPGTWTRDSRECLRLRTRSGGLPQKAGVGEAPALTEKQGWEVGGKAKGKWDPGSQVKQMHAARGNDHAANVAKSRGEIWPPGNHW